MRELFRANLSIDKINEGLNSLGFRKKIRFINFEGSPVETVSDDYLIRVATVPNKDDTEYEVPVFVKYSRFGILVEIRDSDFPLSEHWKAKSLMEMTMEDLAESLGMSKTHNGLRPIEEVIAEYEKERKRMRS